MWRPTKLKDCLIAKQSLINLLRCNFNYDNILLRGRSGVGKTTICKLLVELYPKYSIIENVEENFVSNTNLVIATTTKSNLHLFNFNIVNITPLSKIELFKELSKFNLSSSKSLYKCIEAKYPNINKILTFYLE